MTPTILALTVLVLVTLDLIFDLQLFGVSLALAFMTMALIDFAGINMLYWQWCIAFVTIMSFFVYVTRRFVQVNDNDDINKY